MKNKIKKFIEEIFLPTVVLTALGNLLAILLGTFSLFTVIGGFVLVLLFICIGETVEYLTTSKKSKMEQFAETLRKVDKR